jgi:hypothetical protein
MGRVWLVFIALASVANAQQVVVPGWNDPGTAWTRVSTPVAGGVAFDSGQPLAGHLLTATQAVGTDLIVRSVFRYRDASGHVHGRSWQSAGLGFALSFLALEIGKSTAPGMVRQANERRLAEARQKAESTRLRGSIALPGLDEGDTIRVIPANTPTRERPTEIRILPAASSRFIGERDQRIVPIGGDAATPYRITSVLLHDDDAPRHANGAFGGLMTGMIGGIATCFARFEYCYPYTAMWGATSIGYHLPLGTGPRTWRPASVREAQ